ncbi:acyl-ACP desaturase [Rhodococcus tukisamuensis]|uniref:Acyl-[acyl-carrier-protein] desaturase n=1 Tax=Rhodococcus tukisamuensis TaxID=168276 RepID=A0A1G6MSL4_9NOCA|nr:acyl-ACP desaturase [Rhodococcus tukisamuensis]SDC58578.1 acyl-[acyl-carrier-protein] desaturase [Rhodococcus tukisamuensis]
MTISTPNQLELLRELEPTVESGLNQHLSIAKDWHPHDYVPWDEGRNFAALGGDDWAPEQSRLSEVATAAMITNLLTEDNLPSYHREITASFSREGAWGTWVNRWTAEENRHGIVMRDFLTVTRSVDPVRLEEMRMAHMTTGLTSPMDGSFLHSVSYVTFQELATRLSHRNTGQACADADAERMLDRIAADENLHMVFYRTLAGAALDLTPDAAMDAITEVVIRFQMPGLSMPDFRRNALLLATHGIYDLRQHLDDVLWPVLRMWKVFDRNDFTAVGERARDRLADHLEELSRKAVRFEETRERLRAREGARA